MEKNYARPEIRVIRYRRRVKTNAQEFTNSDGVELVRFTCPHCGAYLADIPADADEDTFMHSLDNAFYVHCTQAHPELIE